MPRRKKLPLAATARSCPVCGQTFRPMTVREWASNLRQHELMSVRHKKALKRLEAIAKHRMGPVKRFVFNGRNPVLQLLLAPRA